jgi:FolB domain-containing protein
MEASKMLKIFNNAQFESRKILVPVDRDQILIKGLLLKASIGIFPEEYEQKQDIEIDLILDINVRRDVDQYDKGNILRYDHVVEDIKKLISESHFELVETLAEAIAETCFVYETLEQVDISVLKLEAIEETTSVGVRLQRRPS